MSASQPAPHTFGIARLKTTTPPREIASRVFVGPFSPLSQASVAVTGPAVTVSVPALVIEARAAAGTSAAAATTARIASLDIGRFSARLSARGNRGPTLKLLGYPRAEWC